MIGGAMSWCGAGGLNFILPNTTINGPKYVKLPKEKLHMHVHGCMAFMQGDVLCYRLNVFTDFLKKNAVCTEMALEQLVYY